MSKKISNEVPKTPRELGSGYGKDAYKWMINGKMNVLRSRLLNLADTLTDDKERRGAIKGLIKDFCGDAYYPMLRDIQDYLIYFEILDNKEGETPPRLRE